MTYEELSDLAAQETSAQSTVKVVENWKDVQKMTFIGDVDVETSVDDPKNLIVNMKVKNSQSATFDSQGNNIAETYAKTAAVAAVCVGRTELEKNYALKSEIPAVKFFENYLVWNAPDGKIYRFAGEEVS